MNFDPLGDGISKLHLIDTMPAVVPDGLTADYVVVQAARVSYGAGTKSVRDDKNLLRYLMRHQHMTPFEMAEMKFLVVAPMFVARQWVRHRTACVAGNCTVTVKVAGHYVGMTVDQLVLNKHMIGSEICCYDEKKGAVAWYKLRDVWPTGEKAVMQVTLANGDSVAATVDHRFYMRRAARSRAGAQWKQLGDINIGDELCVVNAACNDSTWSAVKRFDNIGYTTTYEVEVSGDFHGFFCNNVLVHNSINEYSARYSVVPDTFYKPKCAHVQSANNKQGSGDDASSDVQAKFDEAWAKSVGVYDDYTGLLELGVAREEARMILPASAYTQFYWKCDLRNILHFLELRVDAHAQYEIRMFAEAMLKCVKSVFPVTYEAFEDYCLNKVVLHGAEVAAIMNRTYKIDSKRENDEFQQKLGKLGLLDGAVVLTADESAAIAQKTFKLADAAADAVFQCKLKKLGLA